VEGKEILLDSLASLSRERLEYLIYAWLSRKFVEFTIWIDGDRLSHLGNLK